MKEKQVIQSIKNGKTLEDRTIIVKLESHIEGKQADLTRKYLEAANRSEDLLNELKDLERKNGFIYDLSPSNTKYWDAVSQ